MNRDKIETTTYGGKPKENKIFWLTRILARVTTSRLAASAITFTMLSASSVTLAAFAQDAATPSADEEIKKKLNELMSQPNSVLTNMRTFQSLDDAQPNGQIGQPKRPLDGTSGGPSSRISPPLSATIGSDIDFRVLKGISFSEQFRALAVRVENRTDKTLVIDGDRATLASAGGASDNTPCATQTDINAIGKPPTTAKAKFTSDFKKTIAAPLTVGAVPTAETIMIEHGPIEKRYEWDEQRREREDSRFGKRLLYPGDKADGLIYFRSGASLNKRILTIPVSSFYEGTDQASLQKAIDLEN